MKALIVKHDLNKMGGAEYFTLCVMKALSEMGYNVDLLTNISPNIQDITNIFGLEVTSNIIIPRIIEVGQRFPASVYKDRFIQLVLGLSAFNLVEDGNYDLVFFTHCDTPYTILAYRSSYPTFCYIHYPQVFNLSSLVAEMRKNVVKALSHAPLGITDSLASIIARKRLNTVTLLCNSRYTASAIKRIYRLRARVLYPPARVDNLIETPIICECKDPFTIIVVARISPEKQLENAVKLAMKLPKKFKITIVGSLSNDLRERKYFEILSDCISKFGLKNRITILANIRASELDVLLASSVIYFHPTWGEHFGIAPIEALAAGVIPLVPANSGVSEVLPEFLHYTSIEDAAQKILDISQRSNYYCKNVLPELRNIAKYFTYGAFKRRLYRAIQNAS